MIQILDCAVKIVEHTIINSALVVGVHVFRGQLNGFVEILDGFIGFAHVADDKCPVEIGIGVIREQLNGLVKILQGFFEFTRVAEDIRPVVIGFRVIRVQFQGFVQIGHGRGVAGFGCVVCPTALTPVHGFVRGEVHGFVEVRDGFFVLAFESQNKRSFVIGFGIFGVQLYRAVEIGHGFDIPVNRRERFAARAQQISIARIQFHGFCQVRNCRIKLFCIVIKLASLLV